MWHRQVPAPARDKLARRLAACARDQEDTESFLASVLACVGDLPPETTQALLRFRVDP